MNFDWGFEEDIALLLSAKPLWQDTQSCRASGPQDLQEVFQHTIWMVIHEMVIESNNWIRRPWWIHNQSQLIHYLYCSPIWIIRRPTPTAGGAHLKKKNVVPEPAAVFVVGRGPASELFQEATLGSLPLLCNSLEPSRAPSDKFFMVSELRKRTGIDAYLAPSKLFLKWFLFLQVGSSKTFQERHFKWYGLTSISLIIYFPTYV